MIPIRGVAAIPILILCGCLHSDSGTPPAAGPAPRKSFPAPGRNGTVPAAAVTPAPMLPEALAVEEAVLMALDHNLDLAVERFEPEIAGTFAVQERAEFEPELFASITFTDEVVSETDRATGGQFSVEGEDSEAEVGVRRRFATGTTVEITAEHERSVSSRTPVQHSGRAGFRVTQALLRGRRPSANLAVVRQAELDAIISRHELRGYVQALAADTESTYWRVALARRQLAAVDDALAVARRQQQEVEQRIEVGVLPATEAAAARAEVARRRQARIDAVSRLGARWLELQLLLGVIHPGDDPLALALRSDPELPAPAAITNLAERLAVADRSRPELAEARLQLQQRRLETVATRDGLRPRLDFFVAIGRSGFERSFSDAFGNISDWETYDYTVGVDWEVSLGNRGARAGDRAARFEFRQAEAAVANLEAAVALDVRLAVNEAERARLQIAATATTRALEESTVRNEQERLAAGATTSLQVALAQRDLLDSRLAELEAVVAYRLALIRLYLAEGTLLERRGLTTERPD